MPQLQLYFDNALLNANSILSYIGVWQGSTLQLRVRWSEGATQAGKC